MDCGPTCLRMVAKYYGKSYTLQYLRKKSFINREGVSLLGISDAAELIGMRTISALVSFEKLDKEVPFPCIVHWYQRHFTIVYKIKKDKVYVADPAHGLIRYTKTELLRGWISTFNRGIEEGVVLMLEPTPGFYLKEDDLPLQKTNLYFFIQYLRPYKKLMTQVMISMLAGTMFGLIFPFFTQAIVDIGINNQNINFVYTVLIAQLMFFLAAH